VRRAAEAAGARDVRDRGRPLEHRRGAVEPALEREAVRRLPGRAAEGAHEVVY